MSAPSRAQALELDRSDPLRQFRERFVDSPDGLRYLDGHSLGPLPRAAVRAVHRTVVEEWGSGLVESWERWIDLPRVVGEHIAPLVGATPAEVTLADSTSVNLYRLAGAAIGLSPNRRVIVTDDGNFPTDRYVLEGLADRHGLALRIIESDRLGAITTEALEEAVDEDVALVSFSLVCYRTSRLADMAAINRLAKARGALTLWDLSHAAGAVPVDLDGTGADLAVGCTYKYLCGGPGAPAFLFVRRDLQESLRPPVWGWFGHRDQFAFEPSFTPAPGIERFLVGTPPIVALAAALPGIELIGEAGMDAIRNKSLRITGMMLDLFDTWLAPLGVGLSTPREPTQRGSHVAFFHPDGLAITRHLRSAHRTVMDFRAPETIRAAVAAPFTTYTEIWDAMAALRDTIAAGDYRADRTPGRIT